MFATQCADLFCRLSNTESDTFRTVSRRFFKALSLSLSLSLSLALSRSLFLDLEGRVWFQAWQQCGPELDTDGPTETEPFLSLSTFSVCAVPCCLQRGMAYDTSEGPGGSDGVDLSSTLPKNFKFERKKQASLPSAASEPQRDSGIEADRRTSTSTSNLLSMQKLGSSEPNLAPGSESSSMKVRPGTTVTDILSCRPLQYLFLCGTCLHAWKKLSDCE